MSKIAVFNKTHGSLLFKAEDMPEGLSIEGPFEVVRALEKLGNTEQLRAVLASQKDRFLVKTEGVEINDDKKGQATEPNVSDPGAVVPVASEDLSHRIGPAIKIIKEVMKRAEEKRKERSELEAHKQSLLLEQQNAQVIMEADGHYYVTMDGDGIGNQVARAQYTDDEQKVKEISRKIDSGSNAFTQWAISFGGVVIEVGGDEGQVKVPAAALTHIEEFRTTYQKEVGATATVGIGKTISQSIQARELGKLRGKNQVVYWDENTEKELNLRMQEKGSQTPEKKLADSGVVSTQNQKEEPKLGENPAAPQRYALPDGAFEDNQKRQKEYESWLSSQKRELSS